MHVSNWNVPQDFDPCEFMYIASNSYSYIFRTASPMDFVFATLHTTPFLCENIFQCLAQAQRQHYEVQCAMGIKSTTSSGRSVQIAPHSDCPIDLFCSFTFSVTEIPLCKVNAYFSARLAPIILAKSNIWRNKSIGKCAVTLHSCICVMDELRTEDINRHRTPLHTHRI